MIDNIEITDERLHIIQYCDGSTCMDSCKAFPICRTKLLATTLLEEREYRRMNPGIWDNIDDSLIKARIKYYDTNGSWHIPMEYNRIHND